MTNETKNLPELRFPEFSGEWEEYTFEDVFYFPVSTNSLSRAQLNYKNGSIKSIHYGDILVKYNSILEVTKDVIPFITEGTKEKYKNNLLKNGDLIFADAAEDETVGKAVEVNGITEENIVAGLHTIASRPKKIMAKYFWGYYINSDRYHRQLLRLMQGTKVSSISKGNLKKTLTVYPSQFKEQQKIGDFFSKLDLQIELEEQKLEKLVQQKKGYMQKIFSQELRFKDENGNDYPAWEERKLKNLIDVRDGTHESPKPSKEGYLLVTSKNLKNSKLDLSESYFISKEDYESINQRSKVEIGDILFGMIGTIGNPILLEECGFAIKNVALLKTSDLLEKYYILNFLKSSNISKQFYRMNAGGTQKFIALSIIRDLKIDMPSSEEAIKIGNFFNKVDSLTKSQSDKIGLLKERKQGFLQKMFV